MTSIRLTPADMLGVALALACIAWTIGVLVGSFTGGGGDDDQG